MVGLFFALDVYFTSNLRSKKQLLGLMIWMKKPSVAITFFSKFSQVFVQAGNVMFLQVVIKLE